MEGICLTCQQQSHNTRMLMCEDCGGRWHPTCLGLGKHAKPAGLFVCANCIKLAAQIPANATPDITDAAHMLVYLDAQRVQTSSQNSYASSLHRFVKWATDKAKKPVHEVLPPGKKGVVDVALVRLFMAWAGQRYKVSTIESTLSAIKDWHKSKGADYSHLCTESVTNVLKSIQDEQGPTGLPKGKSGMTKPILRLLVKYLCSMHDTSSTHSTMLYLRDLTMILLGFYGMLRRSEVIALTMEDVKVGRQGQQRYVELHIGKSKTDRRGQGAQVTITGTSADGIRIADYVDAWLTFRLSQNAQPGDPFFTAWNLDARRLSSLPIKTGQALAERLKLHLRALIQKFPAISVNPDAYGMHSLRRGGVMAAWQAGVTVEKIQAHGRWKSDAVRAYMHTTRSMRLQVTQGM